VAGKYEISVPKGAEVDILKGGELDYPHKILDKLDVVIGSVHSSFKTPGAKDGQKNTEGSGK
jgi:DNA polymerase (family 10)